MALYAKYKLCLQILFDHPVRSLLPHRNGLSGGRISLSLTALMSSGSSCCSWFRLSSIRPKGSAGLASTRLSVSGDFWNVTMSFILQVWPFLQGEHYEVMPKCKQYFLFGLWFKQASGVDLVTSVTTQLSISS